MCRGGAAVNRPPLPQIRPMAMLATSKIVSIGLLSVELEVIVMIFRLEWAPLYCGLACLVGCPIWGLYLRKLGKQLS